MSFAAMHATAALIVSCLVLWNVPSASAFNCGKLLSTTKYKQKSFTGCKVLKPNKAAILWYAANDSIYIHMRVREEGFASQRGWFALASSDMGSMKGADIALVHKDNTGKWKVTDCHAKGFMTPVPDAKQDWRLLSASEKSSTMTAVITRKLKTCDLVNDREIKPGLASYLMWANGAMAYDWTSPEWPAGTPLQHLEENKAYLQVLLLESPTRPAGAAENAADEQLVVAAVAPSYADLAAEMMQEFKGYSNKPKCLPGSCTSNGKEGKDTVQRAGAAPAAFVVKPPKVFTDADGTFYTYILCKTDDIPTDKTTYMVCYVPMPAEMRYHIIKYTTIYGHPLVHHSIVYACLRENAQPQVEALIAASGPGPYNTKERRQLCESFYMIGPAPSEPTYTFPPKTGLPFGKGSYEYLAIEVHYNNPRGLTDQADPGTGLRLHFQPADIRPYEIGMLTISQFLLDIPPGMDTVYAAPATCNGKCTARFKQPVTMIAQALHMHGLGKAINTSRVRDNEQQPPLATIKAFDYNFQTWVDLPDNEAILYPGEELAMTCVFDSTLRTTTTNWGYGTQDKMCFWWIYYYPAQEGMGICSNLGGSALTVCTDAVSDLLDMKEAQDNRDLKGMETALKTIAESGRGVVAYPMPVTSRYRPEQGCSAKLPKP